MHDIMNNQTIMIYLLKIGKSELAHFYRGLAGRYM